jgi:hypothetical protein
MGRERKTANRSKAGLGRGELNRKRSTVLDGQCDTRMARDTGWVKPSVEVKEKVFAKSEGPIHGDHTGK